MPAKKTTAPVVAPAPAPAPVVEPITAAIVAAVVEEKPKKKSAAKKTDKNVEPVVAAPIEPAAIVAEEKPKKKTTKKTEKNVEPAAPVEPAVVAEEKPKKKSSKKTEPVAEPVFKKAKAPSGYILFCNAKRAEVKAANPDMAFGTIGKTLGDMWKLLTDDQKKPYNDESTQKQADLDTRGEMVQVKQKRNKKGEKKEKVARAPSGYMLFCKDKRAEVKAANPGIEFGAIGKALGDMWKALTDEQKKPYNDISKDISSTMAEQKKAASETVVAAAPVTPAEEKPKKKAAKKTEKNVDTAPAAPAEEKPKKKSTKKTEKKAEPVVVTPEEKEEEYEYADGKVIEYNGKQYIVDDENTVYDYETQDPIGTYCPQTGKVTFDNK